MKNKGFFATVIVALLIFIIISLLAIRIEQKNYTYKVIEEYISTSNLVYERTNFEYNIKNALKIQLDNEIKITQISDIVKQSTDNLLKQVLEDKNMPNTFNSSLQLISVPCEPLNCAYYRYTILTPIEKEVQYKNKRIKVAIPQNYSIENTGIIS